MHEIASLATCSFKISGRGISLDLKIILMYAPCYAFYLFGACEKEPCSDIEKTRIIRLHHGDLINL